VGGFYRREGGGWGGLTSLSRVPKCRWGGGGLGRGFNPGGRGVTKKENTFTSEECLTKTTKGGTLYTGGHEKGEG